MISDGQETTYFECKKHDMNLGRIEKTSCNAVRPMRRNS